MPDKKPISVKGMRRYTQFGLPIDGSVARDATSVVIPSVTPMEREAAAYYNPPIEDVSSGNRNLDFIYRNPWLMKTPVVGDMIRNAAHNYSSFSNGEPVVGTDAIMGPATNRGTYKGGSKDTPKGMGKDMLGVYFGKSSLPKSVYKPTSDYMEFLPSYSIKEGFDGSKSASSFAEFLPQILSDAQWDVEKEEDRPGPEVGAGIIDRFLEDRKPVYMSVDESSDLSSALGSDIGGHKIGMAWDEDAGLPYMSISDAWDFEPRHYSSKWGDDRGSEDYGRAYVQSSLMHRAGNPFKIYDRFYFDPETKRYIPDSEVSERSKAKK